MGEIGSATFIQQYWYVLLTLCLGLLLIILFNLIAYFYFAKRQPVDPVKLFTDVEQEINTDDLSMEPSFVKSPPPIPEAIELMDPTGDNIELSQFRMDALASHNEYREKHSVPPLQYSEDLSMYAQYWAENMAKTNRLVHSPAEWRLKFNSEPLGENVVLTNGFPLTGKGMSDMWYGESYKHNYQELQKDTKSFTQMVWLSTRKVGFGKAKSIDGKWYGCAHYYPEGNIVGLFRTNVLPLQQSF